MAITLDNTGSSVIDSSGTTSYSFTAASNSQMYVLTDEKPTSVTYNSVSLTKIVDFTPSISDGNQQPMKVWYLSNPASGANTLAFSLFGVSPSCVATFTGMNTTQAHAYQSRFSNNGTINTQVVSLNLGDSTTASNSVMLMFSTGSNGGRDINAGTDTTKIVGIGSILCRSASILRYTNTVTTPTSVTTEAAWSSSSGFLSVVTLPIAPVFESKGSFMGFFI